MEELVKSVIKTNRQKVQHKKSQRINEVGISEKQESRGDFLMTLLSH